ncbi:MAG: hypothetical protein F6K55_39260 [Moorea sp. SIO4A3]|nr:hypothetical protein [Moorena sp. SIO4A3]
MPLAVGHATDGALSLQLLAQARWCLFYSKAKSERLTADGTSSSVAFGQRLNAYAYPIPNT